MVQNMNLNSVHSTHVNDTHKNGSICVGRSKSVFYNEHIVTTNIQMCIIQCTEQRTLNINAGYEYIYVYQSGGYSKIRYIDSCLLERVEGWWKAKGGVEMNEEVG
jgi:hypothetical protein